MTATETLEEMLKWVESDLKEPHSPSNDDRAQRFGSLINRLGGKAKLESDKLTTTANRRKIGMDKSTESTEERSYRALIDGLWAETCRKETDANALEASLYRIRTSILSTLGKPDDLDGLHLEA